MIARQIGRNELTVVQTLLAVVDAQFDYVLGRSDEDRHDRLCRGVLLSSPGKKDGLYWETKPGEPESPLGPLVAKAQPDAAKATATHGYRYRLLYGQAPTRPAAAYSYLVNGR
jgi:hypothetical protein